jgi:hypothetical protein
MKRRRFFSKFMAPVLAGVFLVALVLSCDGFFPTQSKPDVPRDHTRSISGVMHKPGLRDPLDSRNGCMTAACHGDDLQGGVAVVSGRRVAVPSCYQCHGALWEGEDEGESEEEDDD